jgi:hypothetical protein
VLPLFAPHRVERILKIGYGLNTKISLKLLLVSDEGAHRLPLLPANPAQVALPSKDSRSLTVARARTRHVILSVEHSRGSVHALEHLSHLHLDESTPAGGSHT